MSEFLPLQGETLPHNIREILGFLEGKLSKRPLEEALKPYSQIAGIDLHRLRKENYREMATDEAPVPEDLRGYFKKKKKRKYFVYFVKDFYQQEGEKPIQDSLRPYALRDTSEHEKFRDMVIVEREVAPGIIEMMIFDYSVDPWWRETPLKEGGFKEMSYLRLRDVLYIEEDKEIAFSQYSFQQHQEEGDAYGCLDMGLIRKRDLNGVNLQISDGKALNQDGYRLWVDGYSIETNEEKILFPLLAEAIVSLNESGSPFKQTIASGLEVMQGILTTALKQEKLKQFLDLMNQSVGWLSSRLSSDQGQLLREMWKGISRSAQNRT